MYPRWRNIISVSEYFEVEEVPPSGIDPLLQINEPAPELVDDLFDTPSNLHQFKHPHSEIHLILDMWIYLSAERCCPQSLNFRYEEEQIQEGS